MITQLQLNNVGPGESMHLHFKDRFNLITGDNGLGKSFILDVAWWALTRQWPHKINPAISGGSEAIPHAGKDADISYSLKMRSGADAEYHAKFDPDKEQWTVANQRTGEGRGRPVKPGIVIYGMVDGSFALWDPARNYWREGQPETRPAYVFSQHELWYGQKVGQEDTCNGIVRDWAYWYKERAESYLWLCSVLKTLSDDGLGGIQPKGITRISSRDVKDIPTISMPYTRQSDEGVAIVHASSAVKRIISMAYMLIWSWREHCQAVDTRNKLRGSGAAEQYTSNVTFILDEIEAHLHPRWQRIVLPALYQAIKELTKCVNVQLVVTTHSPLVMASCEDFFDGEKDSWFDVDRYGTSVELTERMFEPKGTVNSWLLSQAFDMTSLRSINNEAFIQKASALLEKPDVTVQELRESMEEVERRFSSMDSFASAWMYLAEQKMQMIRQKS